jgi:hypothetical protein
MSRAKVRASLYEVRRVVLCLWHLTIDLSLQKSRPTHLQMPVER